MRRASAASIPAGVHQCKHKKDRKHHNDAGRMTANMLAAAATIIAASMPISLVSTPPMTIKTMVTMSGRSSGVCSASVGGA